MNYKQITSWGILVGVALIIATFSYFAMWIGDDIRYMFSFVPGKEETLINSFSDIIESQNAHYYIVNGRYVAHCFVQSFCGLWGQTVFSIANGIAYIFFFRMLVYLCGIKMSNAKGVLMVVLLGLITFQTKMMPSCQIGYIWMFTFMLVFLSLFFKEDTNQWSWWKICSVGIFSLLSGNGQEALSIGIGAALIIFWLGHMKEMTVARYVMMVCFGIGALVCCLSPAIIKRADSEANISLGILLITHVFYASLCVRAFYFLIVVLLYKILQRRNIWSDVYKPYMFYWNAWGVLLLFNVLLGFPCYNRSWFGLELLSIIIGVRLIKKDELRCVRLLCVLSFLFILTHVKQITRIIFCRTVINNIENQYANSWDGKVYVDIDETCVLPTSHRAYSYFQGFSVVPHIWEYDCEQMQRFFNVKYPNREPLQIIPAYLKGKENVTMDNKIIDYFPNVVLAIQSKFNPASLYVNRCINILGYKRAYEPLEIPFDETNTLCEGKYWRACLVDVDAYCLIVPYICDIDVNFGTSSSGGASL